MIEVVLYDYLSSILEDVPVYFMRPDDAQMPYIVVDKTSERKANRVKTATVAFQSYAPTLYDAVELDARVQEAVEDSAELKEIGGVHLVTSYNFTDTVRKVPRYQSVFEITYY